MSIRFDVNTEGLKRTASVPNNTSFTVCFWVYIVANLGSGVMQGIFTLNSAQYTCYMYWNHAAAPGSMVFGTYDNIGATFGINGFAQPAVGQWAFVWMRCAGTGANQQECGYGLRGATSFTKAAATMTTGRNNPTYFVFGNDADTGTQGASCRIGNAQMYDTPLTDAELLAEMQCYVPVRTANLVGWWPLMDVALAPNLIDYSGLARDLTVMGTLSVEDGPPIAWA